MGAAAHNISAFAPVRLGGIVTVRAQLAIGGLRVIAPSAVSTPAIGTPAIGTRFLVRKGLPTSTAVTVLAVAQSAQLVLTIVVVRRHRTARLDRAARPLARPYVEWRGTRPDGGNMAPLTGVTRHSTRAGQFARELSLADT